jgi:hypothetical protein
MRHAGPQQQRGEDERSPTRTPEDRRAATMNAARMTSAPTIP